MKTNLYCSHHQCWKSGAPNWGSFIPHTVLSPPPPPNVNWSVTVCRLGLKGATYSTISNFLKGKRGHEQHRKGVELPVGFWGSAGWRGGWQLWTHTLPTLSRLGFIEGCFAADVSSRGTNMIIKTSLEKTIKLWFVVNAAFSNWQEDGFGVQPTYINPLFYNF